MRLFAVIVFSFIVGIVQAAYERSWSAVVGGPITPAGKRIQIDLPGSLHLHNCGGSDGAGLCVFTSISHTARWQGIDLLKDFRDYMKAYPGGGYPEKVDAFISKIAREKNLPVPRYIHVRATDLEVLKKACATGRMPCVTYYFSPTRRYRGEHIAHMVNLSNADDSWFSVLDNNYEGEQNYEHLTPREFEPVFSSGNKAWAIIFLDHGPPPPLRGV